MSRPKESLTAQLQAASFEPAAKMLIDRPAQFPYLFAVEKVMWEDTEGNKSALLCWQDFEDGNDPTIGPPTNALEGCLEAFLKLATYDVVCQSFADKVGGFVGRWGPLDEISKPQQVECDGKVSIWRVEPLSLYLMRAQQFRALVTIAIALNNGERGKRQDWIAARPGINLDQQFWDWMNDGMINEKELLASDVTRLIKEACLIPIALWEGEHLEMGIAPIEVGGSKRTSAVLQTLVIQLVALLRSPNGIWQCGTCGNFFTPETRKGRGGGKRYCGAVCAKKGHNKKDAERMSRNRAQESSS